MTSQVTFQLGSEVLQASALHDFPWPDFDPETITQRVVPWSDAESRLLDKAIENVRFPMSRFLEETKQLTTAEKIWRLLTAKAFNFNGEHVRGDVISLDHIRQAVAAGERILIAYPLVCKINNTAKRLSLVGCTCGERAVIRFFRNLDRLVREIYRPGLRVLVLSDATLYNAALQVPPPSAYAYMADFEKLIGEERAADAVEIHDYTARLAPFHREFEGQYNRHYRELSMAAIDIENLGSLPTSVRTNVNSRRLGLTYKELRALFGPHQTSFTPVRASIDQQAILALTEQLAIKMACVDLDLPSRLWPNHVRATCHKGTKNDRHVLGLRMYPEYYAASKLLPYHGMPLLDHDKSGAARLLILPEISLRGEETLVRVTNDVGDPVMYRLPVFDSF